MISSTLVLIYKRPYLSAYNIKYYYTYIFFIWKVISYGCSGIKWIRKVLMKRKFIIISLYLVIAFQSRTFFRF